MDSDYEQHKMYYLEDILESPIYWSYETETDLSAEDVLIVFLYKNRQTGQFVFTVESAYESADKKDLIKGRIKTLGLSTDH